MKRAVRRCRERKITIPTFAQLKDPTTIPQVIRDRLGDVGVGLAPRLADFENHGGGQLETTHLHTVGSFAY